MCVHGKIQCTNTHATFTNGNTYDVLQFVANSNVVDALAIDDNGDLVVAENVNGTAFTVVSVTGPTRVI